MSTPYPTSWAGVGGSVATALFQTIIQDALAGGSDWLKVTFAISQGWTRSTFEKVYDYIADSEPHDNVGITSDGILDVFEAMLEETTKLEVFVGKEIAQEMFAETIQEALSNAVQYNLGGAVQSILNIWRGSYPLSYDEIDEVITTLEDMDSDLASLLIAQAGSNLPATEWRMKVGFDRYIEDKLIALRGQLHEIVTRINDMVIWLHERSYTNALRQFDNALNALNDAYERAIGLTDMTCERALARLFELKGELKTVSEWWNYTKEHPEDAIIDHDEVYKVSLENKLEAEATYNTVLQVLSAVDSSLTNLTVDLTGITSKVKDVVTKCVNIYDNIIWSGQLNVSDVIKKINEIIQKVSAYRHSVNLQTEISYPAGISFVHTVLMPGLKLPSISLRITGVNFFRIVPRVVLQIHNELSPLVLIPPLLSLEYTLLPPYEVPIVLPSTALEYILTLPQLYSLALPGIAFEHVVMTPQLYSLALPSITLEYSVEYTPLPPEMTLVYEEDWTPPVELIVPSVSLEYILLPPYEITITPPEMTLEYILLPPQVVSIGLPTITPEYRFTKWTFSILLPSIVLEYTIEYTPPEMTLVYEETWDS